MIKRNQKLVRILNYLSDAILIYASYYIAVYLKYIIPICEFLKISPNYLFLGTSDTGDIDNLTPMENEVLKLFRSVDDTRKKCIRETLRLFAEKKQ